MSLPICSNSGQVVHKIPSHLKKGYRDDECQSAETERHQIREVLDRWMDQIEVDCGLKTRKPDPCAACYPPFSCLAATPNKRPFCMKPPRSPLITNIPIYEVRLVSDKHNVSDQDDRIEIKLYEDKVKDIPVWERPRIRSQKLIGGEFKKLTDCFKKNGMDLPDCPRTPSCRVIGSMEEWIEVDKNARKQSEDLIECCCCPGLKSTLPRFKCVDCQPPIEKKSNRPGASERSKKAPQQQNQSPYQRRLVDCLKQDNPRSSGEMWQNDMNVFGRSK